MAIGPGKYDMVCTAAREATAAEGVILIVLGGYNGSGFSAQVTPDALRNMPAFLRDVARQLEETGVAE